MRFRLLGCGEPSSRFVQNGKIRINKYIVSGLHRAVGGVRTKEPDARADNISPQCAILRGFLK